jgi:hypothetical protein
MPSHRSAGEQIFRLLPPLTLTPEEAVGWLLQLKEALTRA